VRAAGVLRGGGRGRTCCFRNPDPGRRAAQATAELRCGAGAGREGAREVARAMKEHERRKREEAQQAFRFYHY